MNLYAFVHNDPLTHFDEYGLFLEQRSLVAFNSHTITQNWGAQINPFSTGVNQSLVNSGYGALRFANTAMHALASPFRSYDFKTNSFNFTMGDSYQFFNNWLDQKQKMTQPTEAPNRRQRGTFIRKHRNFSVRPNLPPPFVFGGDILTLV